MYHVNKSSKNTHDETIIRKEKGRKEKGRKEKEKKMNNVVNMFINRAAIFDSWMEFQAQRWNSPVCAQCANRRRRFSILFFSFRFLAIHNWSRSIINTNKRISMKKKKKNAKRFLYRTKVCHGTSLVLDDSKGMSVEKNAWPLLFH